MIQKIFGYLIAAIVSATLIYLGVELMKVTTFDSTFDMGWIYKYLGVFIFIVILVVCFFIFTIAQILTDD
jgi:hypothetical protein